MLLPETIFLTLYMKEMFSLFRHYFIDFEYDSVKMFFSNIAITLANVTRVK